ncbi:16S rRNA pseudouridine(516) synthase [Aquabacterium sp. J223]|uniref:16S rRNA pseudouridine(516) synthase n=1 Tax=Aquabacterium sp. J223 TaxID=2898431 RepID=UPI0021ADE995|nr:16S rRNA pseudouridine(516) synthase [Aquabacterium sp. J223]UUX94077.1 pseudouridine synthase [Aquabacterium sp. J223]
MQLAALLFSQGFGTRRECAALVRAGEVRVGGVVVDEPWAEVEPTGLVVEVGGVAWPYHPRALVLLHKPPGYECSQKPGAWPSVMTLLPPPLRRRGVQPVGRLDQDTTGLLLLTDDGGLLHRLTHPKRHVAKVYQATCADPVTEDQLTRLREGVVLHDDPAPARAASAATTGPHALELTLTEGRYHQVKRMVAAVGNRVVALHRSRFGPLALPDDLPPGRWRWLDAGMRFDAAQDAPG